MKYLQDYTQDATSALLEKYGVFFAFSNKQIDKLTNILGRIAGEPDTEPEDAENIAYLMHQIASEPEITLDMRRKVQGWQINTAGINQ